jgi:hypothetical protein
MYSKGWKVVSWTAWVPAVVLCVVGLRGITPLEPNHPPGEVGRALLELPHLLGVVVVFLACRANLAAVVIALLGCAVGAYVPWLEQTSRQTEGFEYDFNNFLGWTMCCGANWGILLFSSIGVLVSWSIGKEHAEARDARAGVVHAAPSESAAETGGAPDSSRDAGC